MKNPNGPGPESHGWLPNAFISSYGPYHKAVKGCGIWNVDQDASSRQNIGIRAKAVKDIGFRIVRNK